MIFLPYCKDSTKFWWNSMFTTTGVTWRQTSSWIPVTRNGKVRRSKKKKSGNLGSKAQPTLKGQWNSKKQRISEINGPTLTFLEDSRRSNEWLTVQADSDGWLAITGFLDPTESETLICKNNTHYLVQVHPSALGKSKSTEDLLSWLVHGRPPFGSGQHWRSRLSILTLWANNS